MKEIFIQTQKEASLANSSTFQSNELNGIFAAANEGSASFCTGETEPGKIVFLVLQTIEEQESLNSWSKLYGYDYDVLVEKLKSLSEDEAEELLVRIGQYWLSEDDYRCFVHAATIGWGRLYLGYATWLALDKNLLQEVLNDNGIATRTFYLVGWEVCTEQPGAGTQFVELNI